MVGTQGCMWVYRIKPIHNPQGNPEGWTQGKQENGQESVPQGMDWQVSGWITVYNRFLTVDCGLYKNR